MDTPTTKKWKLQNRHGWGWSVYTPDGIPGHITPLCTAQACETYCKVRNAGGDHDAAWAEAMKHGCPNRDCDGKHAD